jgi:4-amino-4-deoxy-L-arabinose transferase-like glycosyltransferase
MLNEMQNINLMSTFYNFKNTDRLSFIISAAFFFTIFYVSFFHHLYFTEPDGIFYYNAGGEILKGNIENIDLPGSSIAGPVLHAFLGNLLGDGFLAGKIISLLGGTGIVFLSYFITKNLFDHKVALLTQLFFAVNAKIIFLSVMVLNEIPPLFFIIISLYFATKKQKRIHDFILVGLFLGISFSFRYQSVIILFAFLIFLLIFERKKILKLKQSLLTFFSFLFTTSPILIYNLIIFGKLFTGKSNMYILDTFKFQTEQWHQKIENIVDDGLISAFYIDPNLFLKNYFYNLLYHNPDHLFKFSIDVFDSLSIIPIFPIVGMISVFGGFLYITKIQLTKLQILIMSLTFCILFLLILFFGEIEYHFMLLVILPFVVLGLSNIKKIPDNIKFLLLVTIIFIVVISIIPVYRSFQLLPIWIIFPALSSLFFIKGIPVIQTKIKQLIQGEIK